MSIFEFDGERYRKMMQKEYREEGHKAGLEEGHQTMTLDFLSEFGEILVFLKEKILGGHNLDTLSRWVKLAAKAKSVEDFERKMN